MSTRTMERHICVFFLSCVLVTALFRLKKAAEKQKFPKNIGVARNFSDNNFTTESAGNFVTMGTDIFEPTEFSGEKHPVYILGLFELTTKWGKRAQGQSEIAAAQLAIKHINEHNLLPEYTIELLTNDTKCDPGVGIDTFFHAIYSEKSIVALLGTSCSNVTESLARVVPHWNILQVSFGSTSPSLSDRKKFPLFFRTIAPDSSHNVAKVHFVKHFGWKVVATFCQGEDEFLLPINDLINKFEKANVTCMVSVTFSLDNYKDQLLALQTSEVRIIIGSFSPQLATKIFCEAYKLDMYGPDYVWVLQYQDEFWWNDPSECMLDVLGRATEGLILVADYNFLLENDTSISGLDNTVFDRELNISKPNISKYATLTYDAVWAIGLTLRNLERMYDRGHLRHFDYNSKDVVYDFVEEMGSLNFVGISRPASLCVLVEARRRWVVAGLLQFSMQRKHFIFIAVLMGLARQMWRVAGGKITEVAIYNSNTNRLNFRCKICSAIVWQGGQVPIAQRILKVTVVLIPRLLFYLTICASVLGVVTSLMFLFFNLYYRRVKTVKLSSPKLNNMAVFGCILVYIYVSLLGIDTRGFRMSFTELCTVRVYLLSAGFSMVFGSTFAKTYRIHRIFAYCGGPAKVKDKLLKDKQLILLNLVPLMIDAIIVSLWVMIDPLERQLYNLTLEINDEDRQVVYQPQIEVCRSQNTTGWFLALYGYKGLILIMGVFMAWETRHIKVPALNDSQYIGICVYSAVFTAIITTLSSLMTEYVILSYVAETSSILISASLTLFLLFLPKLKSVFNRINCQDPVMQSMGLKIECNTRRFVSDDPRELMYRLEVQNKVYRCELQDLNLEIARLENLLLEQPLSSKRSSVASSATHLEGLFTIFKGDCTPSVAWNWSSSNDPPPAALKVTNRDPNERTSAIDVRRDAGRTDGESKSIAFVHRTAGFSEELAARIKERVSSRVNIQSLGNKVTNTF